MPASASFFSIGEKSIRTLIFAITVSYTIPVDYSEAISFLYHQLPMYQQVGISAFKKDLTNVRILLQALGNPQQHFPSIHIAGTNGKGSSAHSLAAILQSAGYRTGLYTSPHLKSFTERIRVNGAEMTEHEVVAFVEQYQPLMQAVQPSFFEVTVAMAFHYFARQQVAVAVVEVGLGGRLDSTNIIRPDVCLITTIGYDHTDMLGETLDKIAYEKAGIIKPNVPVVIGQRQPETSGVFEQVAHDREAPLYFAEDQYQVVATDDRLVGQRIRVRDQPRNQSLDITLSLGGRYQLHNVAGILATVDQLQAQGWQISLADIRMGLANVVSLTGLKGRWQVLHQHPLCLADTGHNAEAWRETMKQLRTYAVDEYHFVLGVTRGKDVSTLLSLLPTEGNYYFCQARGPRALPARELAAQARAASLHGEVIEDVPAAYQRARQRAQPNDLVFVGGSSFVVAELPDI